MNAYRVCRLVQHVYPKPLAKHAWVDIFCI
jgi:hypothetical protein